MVLADSRERDCDLQIEDHDFNSVIRTEKKPTMKRSRRQELLLLKQRAHILRIGHCAFSNTITAHGENIDLAQRSDVFGMRK